MPHHHPGGVQAVPREERPQALPGLRRIELPRGVQARESRAAGQAGVIGLSRRRVPEHHHRVAYELVDRAAGRPDGPRHRLEVAAERLRQRIGRELLGEAREALDVGEEKGDLLGFASEPRLLVGLVEPADELESAHTCRAPSSPSWRARRRRSRLRSPAGAPPSAWGRSRGGASTPWRRQPGRAIAAAGASPARRPRGRTRR